MSAATVCCPDCRRVRSGPDPFEAPELPEGKSHCFIGCNPGSDRALEESNESECMGYVQARREIVAFVRTRAEELHTAADRRSFLALAEELERGQ